MDSEVMVSPGRHRAYTFQSDDGVEVWVRREAVDEGGRLPGLFDAMIPAGRRDSGAVTRENGEAAQERQDSSSLVARSSADRAVWLAFADLPERSQDPVAGAHYVRTGPGVAEVTVVVRDDMQRRGIGSQLLNFVLARAKEEGIQRIEASFDAGNQAIWQLLTYSPYHVTWDLRGDQAEATIYLQAIMAPEPLTT